MDQSCIQSQRQSIYLPAVRDRVFAPEWQKGNMQLLVSERRMIGTRWSCLRAVKVDYLPGIAYSAEGREQAAKSSRENHMIVQKFGFLYRRFLIGVVVFTSFSIASAQKEQRVTIIDGQTAEVRILTEIPEATEPCAPAECEWWNQIRKANSDLNQAYKRRDEKSKRAAIERFFLLLNEARDKSYKVPVRDRPPQPLLTARPAYPYVAKKNKVKGTVKMSVEIGDYGLVTDIKVTEGPGWGLNESAIESTRQAFFLPAIKDGGFVAYKMPVEVCFDCDKSRRQ